MKFTIELFGKRQGFSPAWGSGCGPAIDKVVCVWKGCTDININESVVSFLDSDQKRMTISGMFVISEEKR